MGEKNTPSEIPVLSSTSQHDGEPDRQSGRHSIERSLSHSVSQPNRTNRVKETNDDDVRMTSLKRVFVIVALYRRFYRLSFYYTLKV